MIEDDVRVLIRENYPSFTDPNEWAFVVTAIYLALFVVGMCGNAASVTLVHERIGICALLAARKTHSYDEEKALGSVGGKVGAGSEKANYVDSETNSSSLTSIAQNYYIFVYLLAMSLVDMMVLMSLPSAMVDSFIGVWIFGTIFCKLHQFCSTIGRLASVFLICMMAVSFCFRIRLRLQRSSQGTECDNICTINETPTDPLQTKSIESSKLQWLNVYGPRSHSLLLSIIASVLLIFITFIFLIPILIYVHPQKIFLFDTVRNAIINNISTTIVTHYRIFKCVDTMPTSVLVWFTSSTFLVGYLFTLVFFISTIFSLIITLKNRPLIINAVEERQIKRISAYIVMIGVLYYASWAPYWSSVFYASYVNWFGDAPVINEARAKSTLMLVYMAHIFFYANSALNWVFYMRMIAHLRPQQKFTSKKFSFNQTHAFLDTFGHQRLTRANRCSSENIIYGRPQINPFISISRNERKIDDSDEDNTAPYEGTARLLGVRGSVSADSINLIAQIYNSCVK